MPYSVTLVCKLRVKCTEGFRKHDRMELQLNNFNMTKGEKIFLSNGLSKRNEGKLSGEVLLFELLIIAKFPCCPFQGKLSLLPFLKFPASSNFLSLSFPKKISCSAEERKNAYMFKKCIQICICEYLTSAVFLSELPFVLFPINFTSFV